MWSYLETADYKLWQFVENETVLECLVQDYTSSKGNYSGMI